MVDFLQISTRITKNGIVEVFPKFRLYPKSSDLLIRGGDFYAIWIEELGIWSTNESDALQLIDRELEKYVREHPEDIQGIPKILYMWDSSSGMIDSWHKYCQKQMRDSYCMLDESLIFSNTPVNKKDYASKRLSYPLEPGECPAYEKIISTLYSEEERHKLEWAIGSIITGDSKSIQKFMVLYGEAGTGKSTILNIIQQLFEGYYAVFDAKALGSASNAFALEAFKTNPLVAIQHDGDLSKIEDNTRLNSLVSHEEMTINEKFKAQYTNKFKCFLFMGTNRPVKITDAKSGLLRRLIDVTPSGNKLKPSEYKTAVKQVKFELGAIACHCRDVYLNDPKAYDDYVPISMLGASNDFYNFILDSYHIFKREDGATLKTAWEMYRNYCDDAKVPYPLPQRSFKEELKNYFREFDERFNMEDGTRVRSYYHGFRTDKFELDEKPSKPAVVEEVKPKLIDFNCSESIFDKECSDYPAQYANDEGTPYRKWENVKTKLSRIDTSKLHYVKVPETHIVIDFDIPDENGNKCFERNVEEASKWPPTYAELSKSGAGVHLHYIYTGGDINNLCRIYEEHIEVKVFTGNSSLRRKLTKCNNLPIATISSGLPVKTKGENKVIDFEGVKNEKMLRTMIKRNLNKEYHAATKPSIDYINHLLNEAYEKGIGYDVTDLRNAVLAFAANSTNQADYCIKLVSKMKFKSDTPSEAGSSDNNEAIVFYDVEVFPNLFLVNWKLRGENNPVVRMVNPTPAEIEELLHYRLVGFNCRRYDNHILYARWMGYTNEQLYNLSQKIVTSEKGKRDNGLFAQAYNISYTDVYDFAAKKQSLKKWEIELGIHHQELGLPWDQPVPEEMWTKVAEYCDNDVYATEAVFEHLQADFTARQILADLAGGSYNDTTNTLTTKIIFDNNKKPQNEFNYRNLAEPVYDLDEEEIEFLTEIAPEMMAQRHGDAGSLLPYFPGYEYKNGVSTYRGEEIGEGGKVYAEPGMYGDVALLDITSMHPHSTMLEVLFGVKFTRRFYEIVYGRVHIKHEAWDEVDKMLDGKLTPYIQKVIDGEMSSTDLANALKIAINSVYGLTSANFENPFRDIRNKDNIVAKRGALFMTDLKYEVQKRGFVVVHIKTDSIKIADATPEIIQFVMDFGKLYGYNFEHEATYDRICLVNNAVYIAKYKDGKHAGEWTATGAQFAVPYTFKKLFSKEPIEFEDMCETKSVKTALYLDMNETLPDVSDYEKEFEKAESKYKKGLLSDITFESTCADLNKLIDEGHSYQFIGKVGNFCPVKPGCNGGILVAERNGKYDAATGTKGYRWLEAEMVKELGREDDIDRSYYDNLVTEAAHSITSFGDLEWFVSDDPYIPPSFEKGEYMDRPVYDEVLPWD